MLAAGRWVKAKADNLITEQERYLKNTNMAMGREVKESLANLEAANELLRLSAMARQSQLLFMSSNNYEDLGKVTEALDAITALCDEILEQEDDPKRQEAYENILTAMDVFFQTFLKWRQVQGKKDTWMDMMNQEVSEFRTNLKYLSGLKTSPDTQSEIEMFAVSAETFLQDYLRYLYETNDENSRRSLPATKRPWPLGPMYSTFRK